VSLWAECRYLSQLSLLWLSQMMWTGENLEIG
jgi:hypothetical protein